MSQTETNGSIRHLVVLVTGANKGIGRETVRQLAALGHTVYLASRDTGRGEQAAAGMAGDVRAITLDVTEPATLARAAERIGHDIGHLDVLVNNAAIAPEAAAPSQADLRKMRDTFEVNLIGPVAVTQALLPLLRKGHARNIVNVSSGLGSLALHAYPEFAYASVSAFGYSASKSALNAFTVLLAKELRPEGFRVNSVDPGYTATDLNGHSGHQTVEQGAAIAVRYATLHSDGPTSGFYTNGGTVPW